MLSLTRFITTLCHFVRSNANCAYTVYCLHTLPFSYKTFPSQVVVCCNGKIVSDTLTQIAQFFLTFFCFPCIQSRKAITLTMWMWMRSFSYFAYLYFYLFYFLIWMTSLITILVKTVFASFSDTSNNICEIVWLFLFVYRKT